jgi:hypothetical protein
VNRGIQRGYTEVDGVMLIKSNLAETILPGLDFGQRRYVISEFFVFLLLT